MSDRKILDFVSKWRSRVRRSTVGHYIILGRTRATSLKPKPKRGPEAKTELPLLLPNFIILLFLTLGDLSGEKRNTF
jgi:hypothetical protein